VIKRYRYKIFQYIYANINKNVLLEDIPDYVAHIHHGGRLLLTVFIRMILMILINWLWKTVYNFIIEKKKIIG